MTGTETLFDDQQRPYQTASYEVDQTDGTVTDRLTSNTWYNHRGFQVKTAGPNGLFSKTLYDGAGRGVISLTSIDDDETTWSESLDATGDTVIEQSNTIYDPGSRVVAVLAFQRESTSLLPEGTLDASNSYPDASVTWYDKANRVTHTATFGRDDGPTRYVFDATGQIIDTDANGIPDEAEGPPREPNQSADWIASKTEYDTAGRPFRTTDNLGRVMHTDFDTLNRTVRMIENYVDGVVTETETDTDQTVEYDYDAAGRMVALRAKNPKGSAGGVEDQETVYLFESDINASWVTNVIYPDSADTDSSGTDQVKSEYDRLGRYIRGTDQRGVEHTITFDAAGRFESDAVTNLGPSGNVDDSVLRIERTYDDMSRMATITSYNDPDADNEVNVVNQVAYQYNGYGLASVVDQEHDGTVNASTPEVRYNYDDGAAGGEARFVRLSSVEYPGGREVFYLYPASGIGDALNRVEAIADDGGLGGGLPTGPNLAEYDYLGAGTIVAVEHPAVTGGLTLDYNATGNYEGWDRFRRVVDQQWTNDLGIDLDRYTYTYDYNSNRTSRANALNSALSESYTYDQLDRLVDVNRAGTDYQSWNLDSLGNWDSFDDQGSTETRTHNAANELTGITGGINPTFDAAGNMISGPKPDSPADRQHYRYDAWNRLIAAYPDNGSGDPDTANPTAEFEYDGRNFRVEKTAGGVLQAFFYNEGHQVLEVRENGNTYPSEQYVWDLRYVDAPVVRFHDANTDGTVDDTLYYANDANMNVTALIDATTGNVVERYHYDPYGKVQFFDESWTSQAASAFDNVYLYTGRRLDSDTGLFYYRARFFDALLGRFLARDPIVYHGGTANSYEYAYSNPIVYMDATGLVPNTTFLSVKVEDSVSLHEEIYYYYQDPPPGGYTPSTVPKPKTKTWELAKLKAQLSARYVEDSQGYRKFTAAHLALERTLGFDPFSWWSGWKVGVERSGTVGEPYAYQSERVGPKGAACDQCIDALVTFLVQIAEKREGLIGVQASKSWGTVSGSMFYRFEDKIMGLEVDYTLQLCTDGSSKVTLDQINEVVSNSPNSHGTDLVLYKMHLDRTGQFGSASTPQ